MTATPTVAQPLTPEWPTRPDGTNLTIAEMTPAQARAQRDAALARVRARCVESAAS